jgi:hypothetical protein
MIVTQHFLLNTTNASAAGALRAISITTTTTKG